MKGYSDKTGDVYLDYYSATIDGQKMFNALSHLTVCTRTLKATRSWLRSPKAPSQKLLRQNRSALIHFR